MTMAHLPGNESGLRRLRGRERRPHELARFPEAAGTAPESRPEESRGRRRGTPHADPARRVLSYLEDVARPRG